jgi:hypothetical protein
MYEFIVDILKKDGPASISSICDKVNQIEHIRRKREKPVQLSHIKSVIRRKNDLFAIENDIVSLKQEKELVSLVAHIGGYPGPSYQVNVDFIHNCFYFFEWKMDSFFPQQKPKIIPIGSVEQFKRELCRIRPWNWHRDYHRDTLILDGTSWSIKLKTKGKIYESEGFESFPKEWKKFTKAIADLTGLPFQ